MVTLLLDVRSVDSVTLNCSWSEVIAERLGPLPTAYSGFAADGTRRTTGQGAIRPPSQAPALSVQTADSTSVLAKSAPLNSRLWPAALASAYEKQSPKLRPAGCLPFPKSTNAWRAIRACSSVTGSTTMAAVRSSASSWEGPDPRVCASTTIETSTKVAAEIRRSSADTIASTKRPASGSSNRMATSAEVSMITVALRARRREGRRGLPEARPASQRSVCR